MDTNLLQRCIEIIGWHDTAILQQGVVREFANDLVTKGLADEQNKLRCAESRTAREAMEYVVHTSTYLAAMSRVLSGAAALKGLGGSRSRRNA